MSERKVLNVSVGRLGFSTWGETSRSSGQGGAVRIPPIRIFVFSNGLPLGGAL